ncbi:2TM domain-containing protein [Aquimarina sp. 2201CG5-10]|uniref:2TM domain-containing protein n=1 Tax=Aquimarina callyspongiae TaxID=3098150 RepID=UPI002AB3C9C5|nr:2TM domain-containing protein [Aquimarina sp. 2201CG5-10]MDY8137387.1 2TM domain-containing protein [Aquimarina sp. 2201CG5-10]
MKNIKNIKLLVIAILLVTVIVGLINFIFSGFKIGRISSIEWWGIALIYSTVLTVLNSTYFGFINKRYSWKDQGLKKLFIGAGGAIVVTILGYAFCEYLVAVIILEKQTTVDFLESQSPGDYLFPLLFTTIISLFFHAFYFYKELQKQKITEQKIIAGTASAKFAALKNQLDPHFLFNSLNVLTSLIEENPRMAQKFTTSLSKVYRYVLEQKNKELVTIDEELNFAKTYMTLVKLRFEDSIIFDIPEKSSNPEAKVVPLSLQILLENTIKHNIVMPEKPLHIKIYEEDGFLIVENNLQPKEVIKQSSGVGLGNVQQRYALLTKREFTVYKTGKAFIAKLPILTKKITFVDMEISQNIESIKSIKYERAKDRVKKMKEFYGNLTSYCIVIPFLIFINYKTTGFDIPWFIFPTAGWGMGLFFHYAEAFDYHPIFGKGWEKKKIKEYMTESKRKDYE